MKISIQVVCGLFLAATTPSYASTLLGSSEKTYARECLNYAADGKTLITICEKALAEGKYGRQQHMEILVALGDAYRWEGDLERAEKNYNESLKVDALSVSALNGLGWVQYDREDYTGAAEFFEDSVGINPTNDGLGGYAGAAYRADILDAEEALEYLEAALVLRSEDRWTLREKGWVLHSSRRYEEALQAFNLALDIASDDANAHKGMARALADLNRYDEALKHINSAAELRPDDIDILIWRSNISRWNGHNLRALKDATLIIDMHPEIGDGYVLKARAESGMGFDQLAITTLEDAHLKLPENRFIRYWFANILRDDGQFKKAFSMTGSLLQEGTADEYDYKLHAQLALDLKDLSTARVSISEGKTLAPWMQEFDYLECRILVLEEKYDQAQELFEDAIDQGLSTDYVTPLAQLMIKQGEVKRAVAFKSKYEQE